MTLAEVLKRRERGIIGRIADELRFIHPDDRARVASEALDGAAYLDKWRGGDVAGHSPLPDVKGKGEK